MNRIRANLDEKAVVFSYPERGKKN